MIEFFFYIFALLSVSSAAGVLFLRSPVYSALSLVSTFFFLACIYLLLNAEFVAVIQILVYAGAIMVLFLFVIMLLKVRPRGGSLQLDVVKLLAGGITAGLFAQIMVIFLGPIKFGPQGEYTAEVIKEEGSIGVIGELLYGEYVLHLEVISLLLLVAVMGAVLIAKRKLKQGEGK